MSNTSSGSHADSHSHAPSPFGDYFGVFIKLLVLTMITVAVSYFHWGLGNIVIAFAVAATQAALIAVYFLRLKYGTGGNAVFVKAPLAAGVAFVVVVVILTGTRFLFPKPPQEPAEAQQAGAAPAGGAVDQNKLRIATPELVARGKQLFHDNACYTCHGEQGNGKGVAAAALNPKPRDFTSGYWKFGGAPTQVFHTITVGSPGTAMAPYGHLSIQDRWALVHYVRSFHSPQPEDTPETLAKAGLANGGTGIVEEAAKPEIPVSLAMEKLEVPDQVVAAAHGEPKDSQSPGAKIFNAQCVSCHGVNGVGAQTIAMGVNPSVSLITKSWVGIQSGWINNPGEFDKIVTQGFPGRGMPGQATLSKQELGELYSYAKELSRQ